MGKTTVNGKEVVTPASKMKASELKELAGIPKKDKLYKKNGEVVDDNEVVPTDDQEYGAVTDWDRGRS